MFCLFYRIYGHFVFRSPQPPPGGERRARCARKIIRTGRDASGTSGKHRSLRPLLRAVLGTFCHQKYNKSPKPANKRSGIDNQAVFRFGSPCRSFRMGSRRHRRTRVRFPKRYLVRECLSFHKTVIFRLLHFCSS